MILSHIECLQSKIVLTLVLFDLWPVLLGPSYWLEFDVTKTEMNVYFYTGVPLCKRSLYVSLNKYTSQKM